MLSFRQRIRKVKPFPLESLKRAEKLPPVKLPKLVFTAGAYKPSSIPPAQNPEIAFAGRSNVGKSSLINALGFTSVARTSSEPGLTSQINFYQASDWVTLVDLPGYGFAYAKPEALIHWKALIEHYVKLKRVKRVLVLLDARHGLKQRDREFLQFLEDQRLKFQLVLTKTDLVARPLLAKIVQLTIIVSLAVVSDQLAKQDCQHFRHNWKSEPLLVSSKTGAGMDKLRRVILHLAGRGDLASSVKRN